MHFAKMGTSGHADVVQVLPKDNRAWTWYNDCGGVSSGSGPDDGAVTDPGLPTPP